MKSIARCLLTFALFLTLMSAQADAQDRKPNIIVILADDIGASELGGYGHPKHQTPSLDQLGKTGVQYATCFTAPVCHPTRFMLMTGQYGFRNGVLNFGGKRAGPAPGEDGPDNITNHLTFAQLLKPAGYATALAGKWQLSGKPPTLIHETGFDEYLVWGYRNYYNDADREKALAAGINFRSRYWHPSLTTSGRWIPTTATDYGPDKFIEFIEDFIDGHREQPFFIYYPMVLTHGPWLPTPDSYQPGMNKDKSDKSNFQANVEYVDKQIGRIIAKLDSTGLRNNTIVIFTGDNGTGGDGKSTATEKGARVPLIINAPGIVKPRGSTQALADMSDVFPTIMEFVDVKIPTGHVIDGHSHAAFLRGQSETTRDWIFAFQADFRILRTSRWLLEENSPRHFGRLYDCGDQRDGTDYRDVTDSRDPEAVAAKQLFSDLLKNLPAPHLDYDGKPNDPIDGVKKKKK